MSVARYAVIGNPVRAQQIAADSCRICCCLRTESAI